MESDCGGMISCGDLNLQKMGCPPHTYDCLAISRKLTKVQKQKILVYKHMVQNKDN